MNYFPWYAGSAFFYLLVVSRIVTNYYVRLRYQELLHGGLQPGFIPVWVSSLYLVGGLGLFVCCVWSFWIAWWGPLVLGVAYCVQMLVIPSGIMRVRQDLSEKRVSDAVQDAVRELECVKVQLGIAGRRGECDRSVVDSLDRTMAVVEQAQRMIASVSDPKEKLGLMMFLQDHIEGLQSALGELQGQAAS